MSIMECRALDLILISATGVTSKTKSSYVYALVHGTRSLMLRTPVHKTEAGSETTTWNHPMKFTIDESAGLDNRLILVVKIKAKRVFCDKTLGYVKVPIKDLMEGIKDDGKDIQVVSYPLVGRKSNEPRGSVSFSYKFGEKFLHRVRARSPSQSSSSGLDTSFLAGVLIADASHGGGCGCGGGGGGGECGGGCGGGGCGS